MSESLKFCPWCGTRLGKDNRFCGQCGRAIPTLTAREAEETPMPAPDLAPASVPDPAPAPPSTASRHASDEPIVGIIPGVQARRGFLGIKSDNYNLVLTTQRLIFAYVSKEMMNEAINAARQEAKAQGKGFLKQMAAQMSWHKVICRKYERMPTDAILSRYPGSFAVDNGAVRRIRLRQSTDDDSGNTTREMIIEAMGKKRKFTLTTTSTREAKRLLQETLGGVVR